MTPTPDPADLAVVVERTGNPRYRDLCDPAHPAYHPSWAETVRRLAAGFRGEPIGPTPQGVTLTARPAPWLTQVNTCLYRECRTGCQKSKCWAGYGTRWHDEPWGEVSLADCKRCVTQRSLPAPAV